MVRTLLLLALPSVALATPPTTGGLNGGESGLDTPEAEGFYDADDQAQIINGERASIDDYPETGMLIFDGEMTVFGQQSGRAPVCSSTLIAPDVVLLAAHCIDEQALTSGFGEVTREAWAWSRATDLSALNMNTPLPDDTIAASEVVMHPDFDLQTLGLGLSENADIALMFLAEPLLDVDHAYLPTAEEAEQISLDDEVVVVGWGLSVGDNPPFSPPPPGSIYIKNMGVSHIAEVAPYEFKVGEEQSDVRKCNGDSGGPTFLAMEDTDQPFVDRLIGVTSHSYDETLCTQTGGVDTRVDFFLDWIDDEMRTRCEDGSRVWCGDGPEDYGVLTAPTFDELDEENGKNGCGCSSSPAPTAFGLFGLTLVGLVGLRRRK